MSGEVILNDGRDYYSYWKIFSTAILSLDFYVGLLTVNFAKIGLALEIITSVTINERTSQPTMQL